MSAPRFSSALLGVVNLPSGFVTLLAVVIGSSAGELVLALPTSISLGAATFDFAPTLVKEAEAELADSPSSVTGSPLSRLILTFAAQLASLY